MSHEIENRVAVVTGSASGQGRAVALKFVGAGARVALCDVDEPGLKETVRLVEEAGGEAFAMGVDLASVSAINGFIDETLEHFKQIDIVYNNAGISLARPIEDHDEEFWDLIHSVNLKSYFFLVKRALPSLRASAAAAIVNVSSMAGIFGQSSMAAYCSSKGGVNMLTKALAVELAPDGIRVNGIAPGLIETPMILESVKEFSPEEQKTIITGWAGRQLFKRAADPEEVANVALFLVSDQASFLTGEILNVSGGWAAV